MNGAAPLTLPMEELARFCRQDQVREPALFGSQLPQERHPESAIDLLVSFHPAARVTSLTLASIQRALQTLLGHKVCLVPNEGLKSVIREHILAPARVLYTAWVPLLTGHHRGLRHASGLSGQHGCYSVPGQRTA